MKISRSVLAGASLLALSCASALAQQVTGVPGSPAATTTIDGKQLPPPDPEFGGVIKEKASESTPWWPPRVVPPKDAPNVLLIMTDDVGFAAPSTFGGVIPTPALDRIAAQGLRYTDFHSTALCSPTRAALITGRNHHSVGNGVVGEIATGFPGYDAVSEPGQLDRAFATLAAERADAVVVVVDPLTVRYRERIVGLALKNRLPAMYGFREFVDAGGLMSYGVNVPDLCRRAAVYVDKILKGANPSDLPVEQPTKFELIINAKTAKALGLTFPPTLLVSANEVIE